MGAIIFLPMRIDLILWASVIASLAFLVNEPGRAINPETFFFPPKLVYVFSLAHIYDLLLLFYLAPFSHIRRKLVCQTTDLF